MTNDPYHIVPPGAAPGAIVRDLDLQIRFLVDYDITYMRDRVRADLFANGKPMGHYAIAVLPDDLRWPDDVARHFERYGPDLERMVIQSLAGHETKSRVDELERQVQRLRENLAARRPWWRKAYDRVGSWISGVR